MRWDRQAEHIIYYEIDTSQAGNLHDVTHPHGMNVRRPLTMNDVLHSIPEEVEVINFIEETPIFANRMLTWVRSLRDSEHQAEHKPEINIGYN